LLDPLSWRVPILVAGDYKVSKRRDLEIYALNPSKEQLDALGAGAGVAQKLVDDWLPRQLASQEPLVQVFQLAGASDVPFESGAMLFEGFSDFPASAVELRMAHQFAHANFYSARPWIYEGLANFAQALMAEQQGGGRDAAIAYMKQQLAAVVQEEKDNLTSANASSAENQNPNPSAQVSRARLPQQAQKAALAGGPGNAREPSLAQDDKLNGAATSLINGKDELLYRSKAMYVWWMLRDMLGDAVVKSALSEYRPEDDRDAAYMQRLLEEAARAKRVFPKLQLEKFFDDWVYRDRGLPDFRVKSSYTRKLLGGAGGMNYMATVTVENLGNAGAEVPVTVVAGEHERVTKRLVIPANGEASIRIPTVAVPTSAEINDGSVPEMDMTNNTASIAPPSE
jgi:hypothetical protein